jgi:hypothetical protein
MGYLTELSAALLEDIELKRMLMREVRSHFRYTFLEHLMIQCPG